MTIGPGIVITGASGRMGQTLVRSVTASGAMHLAGCVVRPGHAWIGQDVGQAMGGAALGVIVTDDPLEAFAKARAVLDFTAPTASVDFPQMLRFQPGRAQHMNGAGLSGEGGIFDRGGGGGEI